MKNIWKFLKYYLFGFLLAYFAIDMWRLANGDMRSLRKKGIQLEWLVHKKKEYSDTTSIEIADRLIYSGIRVTYTYHEPLISSLKARDID